MGKIPDRWLNYKPIGQQIKGTSFIAFKVPLSTSVNEQVEDNKTRLDIGQLLQMIPNLGMVIDLTNTHRYYSPEIFKQNGIKHVKLMIPGHEVPKRQHRDMFSRHVKDFLANKHNAGKLIGVHCTHGVNRTGFLICYHMVTCLNFSPYDAVKQFGDARGHEIERENYRDFILRLRPIVGGNNLDSRTMNGRYEDDSARVIRGSASGDGNHTRSPDYRRLSPARRRRSPDNRRKSPDNWRQSLDNRRKSPDNWRRPLDNRRKSPDNWTRPLENKRKSPDNWRRSPARARQFSAFRRQSPSSYSRPDTRSGNNTWSRYQRPEDSASRSNNFGSRDRFVWKRKSDERDQQRDRSQSPQRPSSNAYRSSGAGNFSNSRPDPLPSNTFLPTYSVMNDLYEEGSSRGRRVEGNRKR